MISSISGQLPFVPEGPVGDSILQYAGLIPSGLGWLLMFLYRIGLHALAGFREGYPRLPWGFLSDFPLIVLHDQDPN